MRILLLGKTGQLGWELRRTLAPLGEVFCLDYPEIDLLHPETACTSIRKIEPEVIVNATAYTQVDLAEQETRKAMLINATAPGEMARCAKDIGAAFIHYSTDYVFDGTKGSEYRENDPPNPLSVYGASKLAGEQAVIEAGGAFLVLRTSWVYSLRRDSFVTKVLAWARKNRELRIVDDQISGPTWARMLAEASAQLLAKGGGEVWEWIHDRRGLYHLAGAGSASRLEWAKWILKLDPHPEEHLCQEILPARTQDFPTPAIRPLYSALNCDRFAAVFGFRLPDWQSALQLAMDVN